MDQSKDADLDRQGARSSQSVWEQAEAADGPLGPEPSATATPPPSPPGDELSDKLKPVVLAAEDAAAKAVVLSTKGLNKLGAFLERRRRSRSDQEHGPN